MIVDSYGIVVYRKGIKKTLVTDHLGRSILDIDEIHCHCTSPRCHYTAIHSGILTRFYILRKRFGYAIRILSGFRCQSHNENEKGAEKSFHTLGMSLDMQPWQFKNDKDLCFKLDIMEKIAKEIFPKVIRYKTFIHCDVRGIYQ